MQLLLVACQTYLMLLTKALDFVVFTFVILKPACFFGLAQVFFGIYQCDSIYEAWLKIGAKQKESREKKDAEILE